MIRGISLLLGCQLAGEVIKRLAHIPIPGPIIGLLLLFALLQGSNFHRPQDARAISTRAP